MSAAEDRLREIGALGDAPLDIGEAALLLGSFAVPASRSTVRPRHSMIAEAAGTRTARSTLEGHRLSGDRNL